MPIEVFPKRSGEGEALLGLEPSEDSALKYSALVHDTVEKRLLKVEEFAGSGVDSVLGSVVKETSRDVVACPFELEYIDERKIAESSEEVALVQAEGWSFLRRGTECTRRSSCVSRGEAWGKGDKPEAKEDKPEAWLSPRGGFSTRALSVLSSEIVCNLVLGDSENEFKFKLESSLWFRDGEMAERDS